MRGRGILLLLAAGMLSSCISGKPPADTYTDSSGKTVVIESDKELCTRSCNDDYTRCMETMPAENNEGIHGPTGMFGATADCRHDLKDCLNSCKGL